MIEFLYHPYTIFLARWFLGAVLVIAGVSKLVDGAASVQAIDAYRILPGRLVRVFAPFLPYVEIATGFCLLVGLATHLTAILATLLFTSFSIAIGINLLRGRDLDCHCFGRLTRERIGWRIVIRNIFFMLGGIAIVMFSDGSWSLDGWLLRGGVKPNTPATIEAILLLFVLAIILLAFTLIRQAFTVLQPTKVDHRK